MRTSLLRFMSAISTRPDSPCIGACTTLYTTYCLGCGRHYMDVANWATYTDEQKEAVWQQLEERQRDKTSRSREGQRT